MPNYEDVWKEVCDLPLVQGQDNEALIKIYCAALVAEAIVFLAHVVGDASAFPDGGSS